MKIYLQHISIEVNLAFYIRNEKDMQDHQTRIHLSQKRDG